jgi:hypothetical protein
MIGKYNALSDAYLSLSAEVLYASYLTISVAVFYLQVGQPKRAGKDRHDWGKYQRAL